MIEELFHQLECQEEIRRTLSEIRAAVKEEKEYQKALEIVGDGAVLEGYLLHEDAKVRKNAAALIGDLALENASAALYKAYQTEKTLFVRSAILEALEKTNPYPYLGELSMRYEFLCGSEPKEEEKKHIREELRVLGRILRKEGEEKRHTFMGWNQRNTILLTTYPQYAKQTAEKFSAYRKGLTSLGVQAVVDNLLNIIEIRTFRELLFPIALKREVAFEDGPECFAKALAESKLLVLLERNHKEAPPFYFRMDVKGRQSLAERSRYLKRAAAVIEEMTERKLINAPEEYEFEVRLYFNQSGKIRVFLKMNTIPMERFSYRRQTIAASIHPSLAALLVDLAKPYLKKRARILDPCCGVGTMLIERHKVVPAREIYAIDIFGEAAEKAGYNVKKAGIRMNVIQKDFFEFTHGNLFDEIISNMPLRGKRSKEEQDLFYQKFFDKSEGLLVEDGIMVLYSNENGFIKKQLRLHPCFQLYREYVMLEKEGFTLYIIGRKRNRDLE